MFNQYKLTSSSGKELEKHDNAHAICLMYNLLSSSKDSDDLSIGFYQNNEAREKKLTNNKATKENYHVRICFKNIFGFAAHQDNCTYGLGYKLTLQRNNFNHILSRRA